MNLITQNKDRLSSLSSATDKIASSLSSVKVANAQVLASLARSFTQLSTSPLDNLVTSLRMVADALNNIDLKRAQALSSTMRTLSSVSLSAKTPTISSVTTLVRAISGVSAGVRTAAGGAATARTRGTADAIREVREKQSVPGGNTKIAKEQGVLVTGDLVFSMGNDFQFRRKTTDVVREEFKRRGRV